MGLAGAKISRSFGKTVVMVPSAFQRTSRVLEEGPAVFRRTTPVIGTLSLSTVVLCKTIVPARDSMVTCCRFVEGTLADSAGAGDGLGVVKSLLLDSMIGDEVLMGVLPKTIFLTFSIVRVFDVTPV